MDIILKSKSEIQKLIIPLLYQTAFPTVNIKEPIQVSGKEEKNKHSVDDATSSESETSSDPKIPSLNAKTKFFKALKAKSFA